MSKVLKSEKEFVVTNKGAESQPQSEMRFEKPRLPWTMREGDRLESLNGQTFVLQNGLGSIRYMGTDGGLGRFPALYYKGSECYQFEPACESTIAKRLDSFDEATSGDYVGWFDVPKALAGMVSIAARALRAKGLKQWVREELREIVELRINADAQGGVRFDLTVNGHYQTRYGGVSSMELVEQEGELPAGMVLRVRATGIQELTRLGPLMRAGASVRVSRSVTDLKQAVLSWSSTEWEGSALTTARIEGL